MKKVLFLGFVFLICLLFINSQSQLINVSAQGKFNNFPILFNNEEKDRALAATIENLTNRSFDGLITKKSPKGGFDIDFQNHFQNVMLSKIDPEGEPVAACVTSLEEANSFFGRDLKTGQSVSSFRYERDSTATQAARHGMSEQEFEFYKSLITEAAERRMDNPNSATISILNADGVGEGFNDPAAKTPEGNNSGTTLGQQRLNLFNFAAGIWGAYLDSSVPIVINSNFDPQTPCSSGGGVLGSAGTNSGSLNFSNAPVANTIYHGALANKLSGIDRDGTKAEIGATFNSNVDDGCLGAGTRFYYGLDNSTPSGRVNLLVVLLHEMGHGLGFSSFGVSNSTGAFYNGYSDIYAHFLFDRGLNKHWDEMTDSERLASTTNMSNVLWDGANVKIASGYLSNGRDTSGRVQVFTPTTFQGGSSISHYDTAASPNLLMEPSINYGLSADLDLTRQQMRDIGWYRDTNADLVPDTIINVTPNGNSVAIGSSVNITWNNTGGFNRNVSIELSTDGGATFPTKIATNVTNSGSYSWTVPNTATSQARIRVREYDFVAPSGVSSSNFTIGSTSGGSSYNIGGTVTYGTSSSGVRGVSGVLLSTSGTSSASVLSGSTGDYLFGSLATGNYTVTPSKTGEVNGITSFDASLASRAAANLISLTPNQLIAADASGNGTVTAFDASLISRTAANIANTGIAGQWNFVPASKTYSSLSANQTGQNYEAILVGDVSGNWVSTASSAEPQNSSEGENASADFSEQQIFEKTFTKTGSNSTTGNFVNQRSLTVSSSSNFQSGSPSVMQAGISVSLPTNSTSSKGTVVVIPVTVGDVTGQGIFSYSFTVSFNPQVLTPETTPFDTTNTLSAGFSITPNPNTSGELLILGSGNQALSGSGTLIFLRFNVVGTANTSTSATSINFNSFDFNEGTPVSMTSNGSFFVLGPTAANVSISGRLDNGSGRGVANAQVTMRNSLGETRYARSNAFGYFNFADVSPDSYIFTINSKQYTFSTQVVNVAQNLTDLVFTAQPR